MQPKIEAYYFDIISACEEIASFVGKDADQVLRERLVALAIERLLLIIGEALLRIRDADPTSLQNVSEWKAIIGMRNAIVHGYDAIDGLRLRDAVRDEVPVLLKEVRALVGSQG